LFFSTKYNKIKNQVCIYWPFHKKPDWHKTLFKYGITGFISTAIHLLVLTFTHKFLSLDIIPATTIAYLTAFSVSFLLQKKWTFRSRSKKYIRQIFMFLFVGLFNLFFNALSMQILVIEYSLYFLLAQIITSSLVALNSFLVYKYIIFRK